MVWHRTLSLGIVGAVALSIVTGVVPPPTVFAEGAWLDTQSPQNWNVPGHDVPAPMQPVNRAELDTRCLRSVRSSETLDDAQVEKQGWLLVGTYLGGWNARVVQGATNFDGMCRPLGYQYFVFSHGVFAGTLSPVPMNARTDGALNSVFLNGPETPGGPLSISTSFGRYMPEDALCCPSATSSLSFQVTLENGKPLVVPMQAFTNPNAP